MQERDILFLIHDNIIIAYQEFKKDFLNKDNVLDFVKQHCINHSYNNIDCKINYFVIDRNSDLSKELLNCYNKIYDKFVKIAKMQDIMAKYDKDHPLLQNKKFKEEYDNLINDKDACFCKVRVPDKLKDEVAKISFKNSAFNLQCNDPVICLARDAGYSYKEAEEILNK